MERYGDQMVRRLLTFVTMVLLPLTLLGCNDSMVAEMEAQRQEVGFSIEQELQLCRNASRATARATLLPSAQPVDMEAERRELDRMIQRGDWQTLTLLEPTTWKVVPQPSEQAVDIGLSLLMAQNQSYQNFRETTFGLRLNSR
ncbi:hypothetical protein ACFL5Z_20940 [Planctomycetota bacterium]